MSCFEDYIRRKIFNGEAELHIKAGLLKNVPVIEVRGKDLSNDVACYAVSGNTLTPCREDKPQ